MLGLTAKLTYDQGNCPDNVCSTQADLDHRHSGMHQATASSALVGVGLGLGAIGAIVFFTAPKKSAPQVGAGPGGLVVRGTF